MAMVVQVENLQFIQMTIAWGCQHAVALWELSCGLGDLLNDEL
jgi:hypothetical protein